MGFLRRKSPEEKAAAKAEKEARDAAFKVKLDQTREEWTSERKRARKVEQHEKRIEKLRATLQPDETIEAELRTAETLMKKDLIFTSKRLMIGLAASENWESVPYHAITGTGTFNFITKDVEVSVVGRRDKLKLVFDNEADRDRALEVLNTYMTR